MFTLDATTASLEVVLAGAVTTNQLPIVSSFADKTATALTPGKTTTQTNNTSTVTIVAAPAASTQREVHTINIYNADTAAATITVRENDNGTLRILVKTTLSVGDTLQYSHAAGWHVQDTNGITKTSIANTPAGASGDVQYNAGAAFGAEAAFNYDAVNNQLLIPGLTLTEDIALSGDITPSQITANQNDYNPTGLATASTLRLSSDASRNITGLQGGADGRLLILHNVGAQNIVLVDESASSTAGNRFALTADVTILPDQMITLQYDSTSSRWRMNGSNVTPAGASGDVQYNNGGSLGAEAAFNYNASTNTLIVDKITMNGLLDISAAAAGQIKFPATQNASADANTLDDYEEGTWTPNDASGAGLSFTLNSTHRYVKIGILVTFFFDVEYPATANGSNAAVGGLPFTCSSTTFGLGVPGFTTSTTLIIGLINKSTTTMLLFALGAVAKTNAQMSTLRIVGTGVYQL